MKILVLQSRMGIGDMVIFLPFIEAIAKKFNTKVSILVKENSKANEIINNNEYIENLIYLRRSNKLNNEKHDGIIGSFNLANDLKKLEFDKIFIFNSSLRYNLIARFCGIKEIYQYPLFKKKNQHIIKAAQTFLKNTLDLDVESNPQISISENEILNAKKKFNINNHTLNILLGTGGSGPNKRISSKIYKKFIDLCNSKYDCRFFVATGKNQDEQKILNEIIEGNQKNFTRLDDFSIRETLPVIKNCLLSICNDTSFSHLSAALGIETIVLFADTATLYGNYSPRMHPISPDNNLYINENLLPKDKINPQTIFNKFENILTNLNFSK